MTKDKLSFQEFQNRALHSFSYYDILPKDEVHFTDYTPNDSVTTLIEGFLDTTNFEELSTELLDSLIMALLTTDPPPKDILLKATEKASTGYMKLLNINGDRKTKMQLQYLNFILQDHLSEPDNTNTEIEVIPHKYSWDWLQTSSKNIVICSQPYSIQEYSDNITNLFQSPFPSQIDRINDYKFSIGSIFSNGGQVMENGELEFIDHKIPIILFFEWNDASYFIDKNISIYHYESRELKLSIPGGDLFRARKFSNKIYVTSADTLSTIYVIDLDCWTFQKYDISPVLFCNDVCTVNNFFYLIDKQQGSVFKFDKNFQYLKKRLSFGKRDNQLFDPCAIHIYENKIHVLEWFSTKIKSIEIF